MKLYKKRPIKRYEINTPKIYAKPIKKTRCLTIISSYNSYDTYKKDKKIQ